MAPAPRAQTAPPGGGSAARPRIAPALGSSARPGRAVPPLSGAQTQRLLEAQAMRESGRLEAARETLLELLAESPHHPIVLAESYNFV